MKCQLVSLVLMEGAWLSSPHLPQSLQTFARTQLKMKNKIISRKARLWVIMFFTSVSLLVLSKP